MSIDLSMEPTPAVRIFDEEGATALYADPFGERVLLTLEHTGSEVVLGQIILTVAEIGALSSIMEELQELNVIPANEPEYAANVETEDIPCVCCVLEEKLPTEPGAYLDNEGDVWILSGDGQWYDNYGDTQIPEMNYLLAALGPFVRIPSASELSRA